MRTTTLTLSTLAAGLALALTGCGATGIDDITADTPQAERNAIYANWFLDTYGDQYPDANMTETDAGEFGAIACTAYDTGHEAYLYEGIISGAGDVPLADIRDMVTTAVTVYCPEHATK